MTPAPPPYEALSRLLDDDLDPADAAALRARIATEPDVARAWARMRQLPATLAALPHEAPPALRPPRRPHPARAVGWVALGLAAGLLGGLLLPRPFPAGPRAELVLSSGTSLVEGHVDALVGDVRIEIDGKSHVVVEPSPGVLRDPGQEATLDRSHLLAALVGAAITLTVDEGTAVLHPSGTTEPIPLTRGETHRVAPDAPPGSADPGSADSRSTDPRIAALEDELAGLKLQRAFQRAQLTARDGTPVPFTDAIPAAYHGDAFERNIRAALAGVPDVSLLSMNCEEYPCIALLQTTDHSEAWGQRLSDLGVAIRDDAYGDQAGIHEDSALLHGPDGDVRVMAFSTTAPGSEDDNVGARRSSRVKELLEAVGEE